ncbi:hypothetical protein ACIBL5_34330 [Streptomyces sp. NPDC050516]
MSLQTPVAARASHAPSTRGLSSAAADRLTAVEHGEEAVAPTY